MEASAPSARCVCPRITPGCSSNVRLTRSSNSRMRSIWVNIPTSRSLSSCSIASSSGDAGAELRDGGLVGALDRLVEREGAQLRGQDLGSPRTVVADRAAGLDVARDVELALSRE